MVGGTLAGWLAIRTGPAVTLAGGVALGTIGTIGMFFGASNLYTAVLFSCLLSVTAGALVTSGFNMAATLTPIERQGVISSLVMVMVAIGSVILNFVGAAVLTSTKVSIGGTSFSSPTGVNAYITMAAMAFLIAGVLVAVLLRTQRGSPATRAGTRSELLPSEAELPTG
jgi:MFS family permease